MQYPPDQFPISAPALGGAGAVSRLGTCRGGRRDRGRRPPRAHLVQAASADRGIQLLDPLLGLKDPAADARREELMPKSDFIETEGTVLRMRGHGFYTV